MPKTNIHVVTPTFSFMKPNRSHGKYVPQQKNHPLKLCYLLLSLKIRAQWGCDL